MIWKNWTHLNSELDFNEVEKNCFFVLLNVNWTQTKRLERNASYALNLNAISKRYLQSTVGVH